jgi:hypothetical protein
MARAPEAATSRVQVVLKRKRRQAAPEAAPSPVPGAPIKNPRDRAVEAEKNSAVRTIRLKNGVSGCLAKTWHPLRLLITEITNIEHSTLNIEYG